MKKLFYSRPVPGTVGRRKDRASNAPLAGLLSHPHEILPEDILNLKKKHPGTLALVHRGAAPMPKLLPMKSSAPAG